MARLAYVDGFSGASGDMVLGALLNLGMPLDGLRTALGSLAIEYGAVSAERVLRAGVSATKFRVTAAPPAPALAAPGPRLGHAHSHRLGVREPERGPAHGEHQHDDHGHGPQHETSASGHHSLRDIAAAIRRSALSAAGKDRAIRLFQRLGEVEARIHDVPLEKIHLHEVGALDSIIDIVGAVYGMEWLGVDRIVASPLNVGSGTVVCAHGTFPVPAPATAKLLEGVPVYTGAVTAELVTPTGALLLTEYAERFGPLPLMRVTSIGYGAGERDFPGTPNVLRILVGEVEESRETEPILVIECEIDDMNPQLFGPLMDRLLEAGALDVFYAAVQMKKNRPGTLVTVIARPDDRERLSGLLFAETTTIGVRYQDVQRERLARESRTIDTPLGVLRFKIATRDGRVVNAAPEFEDCARLAREHGLSIKDVQALAMKAWLDARPA